jgi:hypothetical protein
VKWATELANFGLRFIDFVTEWTPVPDIKRLEETAYLAEDHDKPWTLEYWCMNFNGSLTLQGARAGVVLTFPDGQIFKYPVQLNFRATNNMVK